MKYLDEPKPGLKRRCPPGHSARFTVLFVVLTMLGSGYSQAGDVPLFHGVGIAKSCVQNKRTCTDDASCTDGNACTPDTCNTAISNTTDCIIQITYADDAADTISIKEGFDIVDFGGDNVRVPAVGSLPISFVSGTTTCVVGPFVQCTIGPGAAQVRFQSNTYVVQPGDPDPLPDQGTVVVADLCDGTPDAGCNGSDNPVPFTAQTDLVSGCSSGEPDTCDDNNLCTDDSCDPATGCVNTDTSAACDDGNACTADSCDPATGCVNTDTSAACNDGNACTADSCDPATGCVNTGTSAACNDGNACTADSCDPATGCVNTDTSGDCDDGNECTADSCDPATGCVNTGTSGDCDDQNECTDDSCDPETGCVNTPNEVCVGEDICRTPGFWKEHAGVEKGARSFNITQAVIDSTADEQLYVCGTYLDNTVAGNTHSVLEAMCVSGGGRTQLVRQLTATALNCAMSSNGGAGDCSGVDSIAETFADCSDACATQDTAAYGACISALDEWNNGNTGNQCHDRDLCPDFSDDGELNGSALCFEPTGAAGSQGECKKAQKNSVSVP
jgi:hypothetical protein